MEMIKRLSSIYDVNWDIGADIWQRQCCGWGKVERTDAYKGAERYQVLGTNN